MITPFWLPGSLRPFWYSLSVYFCHLFLIASASLRYIIFLSFVVLIFAWNFPLVSLIFLKRSPSFPFYCFPLFICIDHRGRLSYLSLLFFGTLNSDRYIFPFLLCLQLIFFSPLFVRPTQATMLPFSFLFLGMVLITASCTMLWTSIHSFSITLSDLITWIYSSVPLYNCKGFDLGHTWMVY